jgi:uncharacterized protein YjbI with pentapeptide repeats/energy-coupling factor transporter ATP-binding protein EcfA2
MAVVESVILTIAQKIVEFLSRKAGNTGERKQRVLKLLRFLRLGELKKDVESVYAHALVEYAVDANPTELTLLFAQKSVQQAFQTELYKNKKKEFAETLEEILNSGNIPLVQHIYKSADDLKPEIDKFRNYYKNFARQSADAFALMQYNEMQRFMMQTWEDKEKKSFQYQVEQYLNRLKNKFQKEFLDKNHYIDLNGEIRKEIPKKEVLEERQKEREGLKEKEDAEPKEGVDYKSKVYKPLDTFIHEWLRNDTANFLVIMGEYGTGKTTFLQHLSHQLACCHLEPATNCKAPDEKCRIPLYFPLRDFEEKMEPFIVGQFNKAGIEDINYQRFLDRMDDDELILMLDGFDEMTQKVDPDKKSRNFDKIRRLIDSSKKSKIILTVRREYFQSTADIEAVFRHKDKANYQFIHLLPFDDDQIQRFLDSHTDDPEFYWEQIENVFDLHDLAKRPVLLQLIVDYLPKVIKEKGKDEPIKASDLYNRCIEEEMNRKSRVLNLIIPNKYRVEILEKLAVWLFLNDTLSFDTALSEILDLLRGYFKTEIEWEYEKYLNEFLTFSFLIREADYQYRISHKSFRDYLTARSFVREINNGNIEHFPGNRTTKEIEHFILEQGPDKEKLLDLVLNARIKDLTEENQWQGTNAVNLLLKIDKSTLKGLDLSGCRMSGIDFVSCDLTGTKLEGADLSDCRFNKTILKARFTTINAANSRLNLMNAKVKDISSLKGFKGLADLDLDGNGLSDISVLKHLTGLTQLDLRNNQLTDISPLQPLTQLMTLVLNDNQLTDISPLQPLTQLRELWLSKNQLTDISPLQPLTQLTILNLRDNQLTDISPLQPLTQLRELYLSNNQLTDISPLQPLTQLKKLYIHNNPIPDDQIASLKEALPGIKIFAGS